MHNLGQKAMSFPYENQQVLNLLPIPIAILSGRQYHIKFANDAMFDFWRRERSDQTLNQPLAEAFPEVNPIFLVQLSQVLQTGKTYLEEEVLLTLNDQQGNPYTIYIDYTYQPILDEHFNVTDVLVTAQDISHKVSAKKSLEEVSDKLEQSNRALIASNQECMMAIDTAKLGTWKLDFRKKEFIVTDRAVEICGLPGTTVLFSDFIAIVQQDYRAKINQDFENAANNGTDLEMEFPVSPPGASDRWIRLNGKVSKPHKQHTSRLSGTILDITDQKMEVIRKNQFIGMVSHELKTPLTSMTGMLQLLGRQVKTEGNIYLQHILEKSLLQVSKMTHMINSFVNLSRLESGKFELQLTDFDMEELIAEYLSEAKLTSAQHQFIQHDCQRIYLKADRVKIGAVLANMVSNAIKYSPHDSPITISCQRQQAHLQVAVKDQGCGIAESDKKRVFERFSHIENPHIRHSSGFGIGLYLCAEIIRHHQGEIWVENNPDAGCTFYFKLPV
jgi:two-component system sensor histidine kinase VicK